MTALTERELELMRHEATDWLPDLCTVQTRATAPDGQGGVTETWASATNVPCKLNVATLRNAGRFGEQFGMHVNFVLSVRHDQAIASGNRVVLNSDTYEVIAVDDDHTYRPLRRAYLRRID